MYGYGYNPLMQNSYSNGMYYNNQQMQTAQIKGRPVSSMDEAKASMIDLDGSIYVFPDISNKKIYTKRVLLDGTSEFMIYSLQEEKQATRTNKNSDYVTRKEIEKLMKTVNDEIENLRGKIDGKSDK